MEDTFPALPWPNRLDTHGHTNCSKPIIGSSALRHIPHCLLHRAASDFAPQHIEGHFSQLSKPCLSSTGEMPTRASWEHSFLLLPSWQVTKSSALHPHTLQPHAPIPCCPAPTSDPCDCPTHPVSPAACTIDAGQRAPCPNNPRSAAAIITRAS